MKNSILKNKQSTAKILGVSIISLFVMMTALSAVLFISPASIADDSEDLYIDTEITGQTSPATNPILEESCGIDIMLVLDSSGSMSSSDITDIKNAANSMVDALLPGTETRMGVVEFDDDVVSPTLGLSSNPTVIKDRINDISRDGNTNWAAALIEADSELGNGVSPTENDTLIIIITDGQPNLPGSNPVDEAINAANTAKGKGTRIVAIGINSSGNYGGLIVSNLVAISGSTVVNFEQGGTSNDITKDTDVIVGDINKLGDILYDITTALCQECEHICLTPNPINDDTDEIPDNDDLQVNLTDYVPDQDLATIDVLNDQTQAQQFDIDDGVTRLSLEFEFVGKEAGHDNVFGYYFDEDVDNFTAIFETTDHWGYNAPIIPVGETLTLNDINVEGHDSISFAIDSNSSNGNYTYYMHNYLNYQDYDRALVFELCNEQDQYDKFVVCFEDLPDVNNPQGSDEDYEDVVTIVRVLECEECEDEPPTIDLYSDDYEACLEEPPVVNVTVTDNWNLNNISYKLDDGSWYPLASDAIDIDGTVYENETWSLPLSDFNMLSEGLHTIYFMADDDCGNEVGAGDEYSIPFYKDTEAPYTESIEFSGVTTTTTYGGSTYEMISCDEEMIITINDDGCGVAAAYYSIWWNDIPTDFERIVPTPPQRWVEVLDGGALDADNEQDGKIVLNLSFDRDCFHEIQWYAVDVLGHVMTQADYVIAVDCTPPDINKDIIPEVFQDNIYGAWSWINSSSQIIINVTDEGCNGGAGVCEMGYVIKKSLNPVPMPGSNDWEIVKQASFVDDGVGDEWDNVVGAIQNITTMDEDCLHEIEVWATDCVGNSVSIKQRHLVDNTPPNITKTVGLPNCGPETDEFGHDVWCATLDTEIGISVEDEGCVGGIGLDRVYYLVWNQSSGWGEETDIEINENGIAIDTYQFEEECKHYLKIVAIDKLGNTMIDNETFYVDEQAPELKITPGTPQCEKDDGSYCVNFSTEILLEAWEQGCCNELSNVSMKVINDDTSEESAWTMLQYDSEYGMMDYHFDEECNHTIVLYAEDCLGNANTTSMGFHVDEKEPGVDISVGSPQCEVIDLQEYCVNFTTVITLDVWERGCCDELVNASYRVWNQNDDWGPWIEMTIDEETHSATLDYQFTDECNHKIEVYGEDCLGQSNSTMMEFNVDEQAPAVDIEVGQPNCDKPDGSFCVTLETPINISVIEQGCCDDLTVAKFRVINDDTGAVYDWQNLAISNDGAEYTYYFNETCNHTIEVYGEDCLGQINTTTMKFHVDNEAPGVDITVDQPNCEVVNEEEYCVNFTTVITLDVWELGCCDELVNASYRVWNQNDDWGPWIEMTIDEETHSATLDYQFTDECNHKIEVYGEDCLGQSSSKTMYFRVDEQAPAVDIEVGQPNCDKPDGSFCVTLETPINISVIEQGCCDDLTVAKFRVINDDTGAVYDWQNLAINNDEAEYTYYFNETCNHTIEVYGEDCLGQINTTTMKFHVDNEAPGVDITVGTPNCDVNVGVRDNGQMYEEFCVNFTTVITLDVWEIGCCNDLVNASYRVWNESAGWGPWTDMTIDPVTQSATLDYQFTEECNHRIQVYGEDCLGQSSSKTMNFRVDESEPSIDIDVGDMKCFPEDGYDYCIRTDTPIDITIAEQGCCNQLMNASYRIINESGPGPWVDILGSNMPVTIYIDEECNHTLEVQAWDCLMNKNTTSLTFHVDDSAPEIIKDVGEPKIQMVVQERVDVPDDGSNDEIDYWVNCTTPITIDANDLGCCDSLVNVSYRLNGGAWIDILNDLPKTIYLNEDCGQTLDIVAKDCLGNTDYHNETFNVDCTPPESEKMFVGPTYPEDLNGNGIIDGDEEEFYWLQDSTDGIPGTKVILTANDEFGDCNVGIDFLHVELWWDSDMNGTIDADERLWARDIFDDDENDSNGCDDYIEYNFTIAEDCLHEIRWYSVDRLGNKELMHTQQHRVDSQPPETEKTIGEPKYWDEDEGLWWVTSETNFNLKSVDMQDPCAVGTEKLFVTLEHSCENGSYETFSDLTIVDNDTNDLNDAEGIIEYNFTLPSEGWWRITWQAVDLLGNIEELNEQFHIVDDTPPHVVILKPTNGWYAPGAVIPSVVLSEDIANPVIHGGCGIMSDTAVGIEDGQQGTAYLIDIFPEFNIIELNTENFLYDSDSHEYIGNIQIPFDVDINGAALFVAGSQDRLGNNWTSIHELIHGYIIDALADCVTENCVMEFLADELSDFIEDQNIVFVGIDSTAPEVEFNESEAPIPDVLYPGIQMISADIFDGLSGVEPGAPCYVTLGGASIGTLPYDPYMEGCAGGVIIPYIPGDMNDVELSIEVFDHAGNKGSDTLIVDYVDEVSEAVPTAIILSPEDNTNHTGTLTIEIQAQDLQTEKENLSVFVRLMHEEEPSMKYYATYNETTETFFVEIDISKYTHGSILDIQAFATDEDGYTGDSDFRLYRVHSNIIFDQWLNPGWNLVNIVDLCLEGTQDLEEVLACLGDSYDWVFEVGSWDNWYRGRSIQDLTMMQEGNWYWINITEWNGVRFYLEECPSSSNNPPVAVNDTYYCDGDGSYWVSTGNGVLNNDNDPDGDDITAELIDGPLYGTLDLNADGSFTYYPPEESCGDEFTYVARDEHGAVSNVATVTIYVGPQQR